MRKSEVSSREDLDAAAQVTPEDLAAAREFWSYWGTPLFNAMLKAKAGGLIDELVQRKMGRKL